MSTNQRFFTVLVAALDAACATENAPAVPETPPGIFYTNAVVAEVPWSVQIVKIERGHGRYEIQSRHAGGGALGLATLSDQVATADTERSEPVAAINGGVYLRGNGHTQRSPG